MYTRAQNQLVALFLIVSITFFIWVTGEVASNLPQLPPPRVVWPVPLGEGIFYFPVIGNDYRASLAAFLKAHPELLCRYFGADEVSASGTNRVAGHTIVCTDTAEYAQEKTVP